MKSIIRIFATLFMLTIAVGCSKELEKTENPNNSKNTGYIIMSGMNLSVDLDEEHSNENNPSTRAAGTQAPDEFIVTITNIETSEVAFTNTYGNIKFLTEPIEMKQGDYKVEAKSPTEIPNVEWETPSYYGFQNVTVVKKETTSVDALVCKLSNIKTTIILVESLKRRFKADNGTDEDLNVNLAIDVHESNFSRDEVRASFFKAQQELNTIEITLTGMYNKALLAGTPEYIPIKWSQKINGVKAGEWRKIFINVEHKNDGTVNFEVIIETWVYDKEINIDIMSSSHIVSEEEFIDTDDTTTDPGAPVLTLANGHTFNNPFYVDKTIFDENGICTDKIGFIVSSTTGSTLKSFDVGVETSNTRLLNALEKRGAKHNIASLAPVNTLDGLVTITGNNFNATDEGMRLLHKYGGKHVLNIITYDSENRRSYHEMSIFVKENIVIAGPHIEWVGGFYFDQTYNISVSNPPTAETFPVVIDVTSKTGVTAFIVKIKSAILTEEVLSTLGLSARMDLINPATPEMEKQLIALGFPIKNDVSGKLKLSFDITQFMPLLVSLGLGETDFVFQVTDADGTNTQTLKLNVVK